MILNTYYFDNFWGRTYWGNSYWAKSFWGGIVLALPPPCRVDTIGSEDRYFHIEDY
jgi:hypothetical protein